MPAKENSSEQWDWKNKANALFKTENMNEAEKLAFCRENGLYPQQLLDWKTQFEASSQLSEPLSATTVKEDRKKIKRLEKELLRKEKALAEAAALLVLSKKIKAIWGANEED